MKKLDYLSDLWTKYKRLTIKVSFILIIIFLVLSQIFEPIQAYIVEKKQLGIAVLLAMMLIIFDAVASPKSQGSIDTSIILNHFTEIKKYLKKGFKKSIVTIDIVAYTGETFYGVFTEIFQSIQQSKLKPKKITLRILLPNCEIPMSVPCRVDDLNEDLEFKQTCINRARHFSIEFHDYFERIKNENPNIDATIEIRRHRVSPLFKVININDEIAFFSIYPITETPFRGEKEKTNIWDYRGVKSTYIGARKKGSNSEKQLFSEIDSWFNIIWNGLSERYEVE